MLEELYDEMMTVDESLVTEDVDGSTNQVGIAFSLMNGQEVLASVKPEVLNRKLTVITHDNLAEFVDAIVNVVEDPDHRPLCKR